MKRYVAEALGTYLLLFCGTGAIVINDFSEGAITHQGIAIAFGLVVMIVVYCFGSLSGSHINPAVTVGFAAAGLFKGREVVPYIMAQLVGAVLASGTLKLLFSSHTSLGMTLPQGSVMQSFILEIILTYILMLVILMVSQQKAISHYTAPVVGAAVLLEALFAGPISGASMNPARSLGPAVVAGNLDHLWIYIVAPMIGAVLASWSWWYFKEE